MIFPKLFNHGNLKSLKVDNGKLVMEGTYGKEEFEGGGGGLPEGGYDGQVIMKDQGEAKWLWPLPPGDANTFLKKTSEGNTYAFRAIKEVPDGGNNQDVLTKTASGYMWAPPSGGGAGSQILNFEVRMTDVSEIGNTVFNWNSSNVDGIFVTSMLGSPAAGTVVELRNGIIGENVEDGEETDSFAATAIWRDGTQTEFHKALIAEFGMPVHFMKSERTYTVYMTLSYNNGIYAFEEATFYLSYYDPNA